MSERLATGLILTVSAVVPVVVAVLFYFVNLDFKVGYDLSVHPKLHAFLNSLASLALIIGLVAIKNKKMAIHRACNVVALSLSAIFLLSYIIYHSQSEPTPYGGVGVIRVVYYFLLLTHIVLAAVILPFILFTFYRAFSGDFARHRKIARITFPLWLYVTVSGVLVYFMIAPYY